MIKMICGWGIDKNQFGWFCFHLVDFAKTWWGWEPLRLSLNLEEAHPHVKWGLG